MSKIKFNIESWSMPNQTIGKFAPISGGASSSSYNVYIPVLMPQISFGVPKTSNVNLSVSCFCNAPACKPPIKSSIKTQNYLSVPVYSNNEFTGNTFNQGARFYIEAIDGNVDNLHITNRIDESTSFIYKNHN